MGIRNYCNGVAPRAHGEEIPGFDCWRGGPVAFSLTCPPTAFAPPLPSSGVTFLAGSRSLAKLAGPRGPPEGKPAGSWRGRVR